MARLSFKIILRNESTNNIIPLTMTYLNEPNNISCYISMYSTKFSSILIMGLFE